MWRKRAERFVYSLVVTVFIFVAVIVCFTLIGLLGS